MDKKFQTIIQQSKTITLAPGEKSAVRFMLREYIRQYPPSLPKTKSLWASWWLLIPALLLFMGTAWAAQQSHPGQPLYTVKTTVNERVQGTVQFTAEQKLTWEVTQAERRTDEAEAQAQALGI